MHEPITLSRRCWLRALGAGALAAAVPRVWADPAAAGEPPAADAAPPYRVGALDLDWVDTARQRPVPVRLYLPDGLQGLPLVVFSHGIGGSRRGYRYLGEHLAGHGVASLHLQHVGSDRQLWRGNVFGMVGRLQAAAQDDEALQRVLDLRFALDTLLAGELAPRVDAARIVAAGHSYGANTTLLACGARVQRPGRSLPPLHDTRLRAAIVLSAPPFYGEDDLRPILRSVTVPSLHVTATEDVIRIPGYWSGAEDRLAVFDATGSAHKWLAVFEGGSHSIFTDRAGTGGALLNAQVKQATRALVLAFVQGVLGGDARALQAWPEQHAGILARFTAVTV
jgi:dienelactone hydrolase